MVDTKQSSTSAFATRISIWWCYKQCDFKICGLDKFGEGAQWLKASERSIGDSIPLLLLANGIEVGITDYVIKIVDGVVTFGLVAIDLRRRRRFERRYRH